MSEFWGAVNRDFDGKDLAIILENWHFVQILAKRSESQKESLTSPSEAEYNPHILQAFDSDWQIQYWVGNQDLASMMTCSGDIHGGLLEEAPGINGTSINHAAKAAITMVQYATLQTWPGIIITDGSDFMRWVVWATCHSYDFPCIGFEPTEDDMRKQERCQQMLLAFKVESKLVPGISMGFGGYDHGAGDDIEER